MKIKSTLSLFIAFALNAGYTAHAEDANQPSDDYPLTTCVVSGEKLGGMGKPYVYQYKTDTGSTQLVKFCCKGCVKTFQKDPATYLKKIEDAAAEKTEDHSAPHKE